MVWFTPAAVGVDSGRSAKVLALGEPADGDFIQVRPTGSQDELSFSPNELTMDKPPRRKKAAEPAKLGLAPVPPEPEKPKHDELLVVRERPTRKRSTPEPAPAAPAKPAPAKPIQKPAPEKAAPARPKGRTRQPAPITVTLNSTPEGEWTVEVQAGSRRTVRPQPVSAGSVAAAAKALGGDIEAAIEGVLTAARELQRVRVSELEAELAAARQALDDLAH